MSASGQIVLQEGRKRDAQKKYEWRCRYFARGVDRIAALIPGIFPRLLEGQTTLTNQEVRDIGKMGEQIPDQELKHYLELRLASTSKDWRRMNTKPRDAKDDDLNALVDHALRVRPALATHRNRADLAALLKEFLERLERDGQVLEKERSCDGG